MPIKAYFYCQERHAPKNSHMGAMAAGAKAMGWSIQFRGHINEYQEHKHESPDICITTGGGEKSSRLAAECAKRGQACLILDLGYIHRFRDEGVDRVHAHYQAGIGGLNCIPKVPCPTDRLDKLGVEFEEDQGGEYILILGQAPGDKSHGMGAQYEDWLQKTMDYWRRVRDEPVFLRRHPAEGKPQGTLEDDLEKAKFAVTYNSTAGLKALMQGVPVITDPSAFYSELTWYGADGPILPPVEERRRVFSQIAYGQWTFDEMRSGAPYKAYNELGVLWP